MSKNRVQSDVANSNWLAIKHSNLIYFGSVGDFYWYPVDKRTGRQLCVNQVLNWELMWLLILVTHAQMATIVGGQYVGN